MKTFSKIIVIGGIILLSSACVKVDKKKEEYVNIVNKLEKANNFDTDFSFKIDVKITKIINDEVSYKVVIDKDKFDLKQLEVLAIHNMKTTDIFPSIGIFEKPLDLLKNDDKKGVILVGYINTKKAIENLNLEVRVYIKYYNEANEVVEKIYRYQNKTK